MAAYEGLTVGPLSAHDVPDSGRACALHLPKNKAYFYRKKNRSEASVEQTIFVF
jgi:hypothetical protein